MSSISQSVSRCFTIFKLFSEQQTNLTAAEIAEHIGSPRSSTAALLKELVDLNMLSLNRRTLTYFPTLSFAQLSAWLTDPNKFPPRVVEIVKTLHRECGETVTASWPLDREMEVILVEKSRHPISFVAEIGQKISMWGSAIGTAYLATLSNTQILARWEKDRRRVANLPPIDNIIFKVTQTRSEDLAVVHSGVFVGASAIAKIAQEEYQGRPLVISIAGPENRLKSNQDAYCDMMKSVMNT